jgi:putative hydrolase of the HAD superfamily
MPTERIWLFDLDNTLHNAAASSFGLIDVSMNDYIARELKVDASEANRLRSHYWHRYGATLLGLMRHHGIRPAHFLHHTHVLPELEDSLVGHPHDMAALRRLRGRKFILTNAPLAYTERVLGALGLARHFEGVIAIEHQTLFGRWRPKPDVRMLIALAARLRVAPSRCVLVEDSLANQRAAHRAGMKTVWMQRWARRGSHGPEVGVYLQRKPTYVYARISSLQQLHRVP